jgi:cholesterol transport system auxiliary component
VNTLSMPVWRATLRALGVAAVAVALTGCISLFPKAKPAGLYRFGHVAAESSRPSSDKSFGVYKTPTVFNRAAMSDRLLSVTNGEAAFISDARWVSPAIVLFDEAVARAFEADDSRARLVTRGEALKASMALRLEVRSFETVYIDGPQAPPEVLVEIRAVTTRSNDRALMGDKVFVARVKAADNRLSAIVPAYDQAVTQALAEIVAWVGDAGAKLPPT